MILHEGNEIVSAGADGYMRFWDFSAIDQAEGDDYLDFFLKPTKEILIKSDENVKIPFFPKAKMNVIIFVREMQRF